MLGCNGFVRFEKYYFRRTSLLQHSYYLLQIASANTCRLSKKVYPSKSQADVCATGSSEGVERPMFSAPLADHVRVFHSVAMATAHRLPGSRSQCSVCAGCVPVFAKSQQHSRSSVSPTIRRQQWSDVIVEATMVVRHSCNHNDDLLD